MEVSRIMQKLPVILEETVTQEQEQDKSSIEHYFGKLLITRNGIEIKTYNITADTIIGRDSACTLQLEYKSVSRKHTKITIDSFGHCFVENLSSTNPTIINNEKVIAPIRLRESDKIRIGDIILAFKKVEIQGKFLILSLFKSILVHTLTITID